MTSLKGLGISLPFPFPALRAELQLLRGSNFGDDFEAPVSNLETCTANAKWR
jgi:hypothetical protein